MRRFSVFAVLFFFAWTLHACAQPEASPQVVQETTPAPDPTPTVPVTLPEAAAAICKGQVFHRAAELSEGVEAVRKIFIVHESGQDLGWNQSLPEQLQAKDIDSLEAVMCVGGQKPMEPAVLSCGKYLNMYNQEVELKRGNYVLPVRLVAARSGQVIFQKEVSGPMSDCPEKVSSDSQDLIKGILYGDDVRYEDVRDGILPALIPGINPSRMGSQGKTGVIALAISPDGKRLASIHYDDLNIYIWDIASRKLETTLSGHTQQVTALVFSADGSLLATGGKQGENLVWDVQSGGKKIISHDENYMATTLVQLSPDAQVMAAVDASMAISTWDLASGRRLWRVESELYNARRAVFSPDSRALVVAYADGLASLDVRTGTGRWQVKKQVGNDPWIGFTPDGAELKAVTFGPDYYSFAKLDANTGAPIQKDLSQRLPEPASYEVPASFLPQYEWEVACMPDCATFTVWDLKQNSQVVRFFLAPDDMLTGDAQVAITADGRYLAAGDVAGDLQVYDLSWLENFR